MQNPAGQDGACESFPLGRRDNQQDTATDSKPQDHIVGSITKNARERIQISLRSFNDDRLVDVRIHKNVHGVDIGTPQGVTIKPANIRHVIETLELAEIAARTEGLI